MSRAMKYSIRRKLFVCVGVLLVLSSTVGYSRDLEQQKGPYQFAKPVAGGSADGVWDFATVDNVGRRLYLAQDGVTVLDLNTGKVTPHFVTGKPFKGMVSTHHVLPVNDSKAVAVTDIATNSIDFFDPQTGKIFSDVVLGPAPKQNWHDPDVLLYEPKSTLLVTVNADSSSLSLVDTKAFKKIGDIPVGKGKLESAAADGTGLVYVNLADTGSIAVVDVPKHKVLEEITLKNCEEPTGLAYDTEDRLVISVCSNGLLKFISVDTKKEVASVKVGAGADGLVYDPERHFAFSFGGDDGTLSIVAVHDRKNIALVQTLKTKPGARLGALDPKTGRIYIPSATFGPPAAPITLPGLGTLPGLNPHTFELLVVAPTSL